MDVLVNKILDDERTNKNIKGLIGHCRRSGMTDYEILESIIYYQDIVINNLMSELSVTNAMKGSNRYV